MSRADIAPVRTTVGVVGRADVSAARGRLNEPFAALTLGMDAIVEVG